MGRCGTHTQINFLAGFVVRFNNVETCLAQFWVNMGQNKEGDADKSSYFKVVSVILTLRGYVQLGYMVIHLVTHTLHCITIYITLYITITHYTIYIVNIVIQLWLYRYIERFFYSLLVEYCENLCDSEEKRKVVIRFYFHFHFFFSFLFFIEKK